MKNYIEITSKESKERFLLPLSAVLSVWEEKEDNTTFIHLSDDKHGKAVGVYAAESYDEIKAQLQER